MKLCYPVFLRCCCHVKDGYWKYIFESLAYNIPPQRIRIDDDCIIHENGKFVPINVSPEKLAANIQKFFRRELDLKSKQDTLHHMGKEFSNLSSLEWRSIRGKSLRSLLIEWFVLNKRQKYNLTSKESQCLLQSILTCLSFNVLQSDDITMKNGKIKSINGLEFENGRVRFNKAMQYTVKKLTLRKQPTKLSLSGEWNRYLSSLINTQKLAA